MIEEAWIPYIRDHATVFGLCPIKNGRILYVLEIVRARPDLINLSHDVVMKEHRLEVLDGFNVNVNDIAEIEFDDLGAHGTKIAACSRIHAHANLNKGVDGHGSRDHLVDADRSVRIQKRFSLYGIRLVL